MKTAFLLCLGLAALTPLHAEVFRPGFAHRSHGHHHHPHGSRVHVGVHVGHGPWRHWDHRHHHRSHRHFGHVGGYAPGYRWYNYAPVYGYYDGYGYDYPYYGGRAYYGVGPTSHATNGLLLGALAGGIIGHNSGEFRHNGWRGAAWGAGLGWLLGSIADANRRYVNAAPPVVVQPATVTPQPAPAASAQAPQQVTIINNYYNSSAMSAANGLFGR